MAPRIALLMVDTISGLAAADYRHDEWGVDVGVSGSQKGLMLPPDSVSTRCRRGRWRHRKPPRCLGHSGLVRNRDDERVRLLALHAQHQSAVRIVRSPGHDLRPRGWTRSSPGTNVSRRVPGGVAAWGWRFSAPIPPCIRLS